MNNTSEIKINIEEEIHKLESKILKHSNDKKKLWRIIPVAILLPLIGPFIPMRRGMLADRMGYQNSVIMFVILCLIILPFAYYWKLQKINNGIFDLEIDIEVLKRKNKIRNENDINEKPNG